MPQSVTGSHEHLGLREEALLCGQETKGQVNDNLGCHSGGQDLSRRCRWLGREMYGGSNEQEAAQVRGLARTT